MDNENINNKAVKRLYELYGENPNLRIVNRFLTEKKMLWHFGVVEYFDELSRESSNDIKRVMKSFALTIFIAPKSAVNNKA